MGEIILASTSPARRALMDGLGLAYRAEAPGVGEEVAPETTARGAVAALAERKARAVAARHPSAWVIGADQLGWFGGKRLGKPAHRDAARDQLRAMAGRTHELWTGVCVVGPAHCEVAVDVARITLYPLQDDELERYLDTGEWEGCAGSYRIEGRGQALMSAIEGDRTSIQGLPMLKLVAMLRRAGVRVI